jgi:hypothetical protein
MEKDDVWRWFFKEYYWDDQIKENQTSSHVEGIGQIKIT